MKVSKNSKYQTHKKSIKLKKSTKLTKNPNGRTGADYFAFFNIHCCKTSIISRGTLWWKKFRKKSHHAEKNWKGDPLVFSTSILSQNIKKLRWDPLGKFFPEKVSQCRKNWKGTLCGFSTSILSRNIKKLKVRSFGNFFFWKKVSQCRKNWEGAPIVSPGIVCYTEQEEKPFWFSSLGQMIQFGIKKFRRTFKN